jgi:site-specific DNA-methyltransferase (adenine-specific)
VSTPLSPRNRTLTLSDDEQRAYAQGLLTLAAPAKPADLLNRIIHQDIVTALPHMPAAFVDLMIIDPPYNRWKRYHDTTFQRRNDTDYAAWVVTWLLGLMPLLKPTATVYVCADWRSSPVIYNVLRDHLIIRNRITWEREKGRGARTNWKNNAEDIWYTTVSADYTFHVERVKLRRRVFAPYRNAAGQPKDWEDEENGRFRLTHPSNLWTDISVPFWSMPENTEHPTQKPEKLIAKLVLASSELGEVVFAPFVGSGTTAVVAQKLGRCYVGVEVEERYACITQKRLQLAQNDTRIQGYRDGVFWDRNTKS